MATADEIRKSLRKVYSCPEWFLGFEVGNATGNELRRHADAVAINTYPSKGYEIRGFEIKVSRSDLKKELENGLKSDEIARYCNYWFLVVPKGLAEGSQIPETWGIIEYNEGKLRQIKKAVYFDNKPDIGFMVAFMRGRERVCSIENEEFRKSFENSIVSHVDNETKSKLKDYEFLRKRISKLETETGINISSGMSRRDERALKIARHVSDLAFVERDIDYNIKELNEIGEKLKSVLLNIKMISGIQGTDKLKGI